MKTIQIGRLLRLDSQHDLALFVVDLGVEQPAPIGGNIDTRAGARHRRLLQCHQPARGPARELEEIDADRVRGRIREINAGLGRCPGLVVAELGQRLDTPLRAALGRFRPEHQTVGLHDVEEHVVCDHDRI